MNTQQKRRHSLLEAFINIAIGFFVSLLSNAIILPLYGMPFHWSSMWQIGALFTVISIIRSYWVRRLFVYLHDKGVLK